MPENKMTDQNKQPTRDRPENEPGATVEVTPEMLDAGVEAFAGFYPDSAADGSYARDAVRAIWDAMIGRSSMARMGRIYNGQNGLVQGLGSGHLNCLCALSPEGVPLS
jgi:hypothetical protein